MKKLFLLFFVSLCFGVIVFLLWKGTAIAASPALTNLQQQVDALKAETQNLRQCIVNNAFSDGRFVDNCDQSITDRDTDLMWEKKDDNGGIHDVDNIYQWSSTGTGTGTAMDGTLFTVFLDTLNNKCDGDETTPCTSNAPCTGIGNGLCGHAGHRDWRIPQVGQDGGVVELETILDLSQGFCGDGIGACINPIFGPTAASYYWSATTIADFPNVAWFVNFFDGLVNGANKDDTHHARAVRP